MKTALLYLKQLLLNHPELARFFAVLSSIISFILETWQYDIFALFGLFFLVFIDTMIGIRNSVKEGKFNYKVLKEKTFTKAMGYMIFIISASVFTVMVFLMNNITGDPFINNHLLNIPLMTSILFFSGVEFLSINDNIKTGYGIKTPSAVTDKVSNFVENQDISKLIDNDKQNL